MILLWYQRDCTILLLEMPYCIIVFIRNAVIVHQAFHMSVSIGIILGMGSANERRRYNITSCLIGWAHAQNDAWEVWAQPMRDDVAMWRRRSLAKPIPRMIPEIWSVPRHSCHPPMLQGICICWQPHVKHQIADSIMNRDIWMGSMYPSWIWWVKYNNIKPPVC